MQVIYRQSWFRAVVLVGAVYALVGIVFALPTSHGRFWRLAAWVVSGAQVPIIAWFAMRWLPQSPKNGSAILALQGVAVLGALAPVYLLRW